LFHFNELGERQAATDNQHNKMLNYCKTIGALAAASALVAGTAHAEIEYQLHTGYSTEYIFRGLDTGDNLTEVGLDASGKVNDQLSLNAGVWGAAFTNSPARTGNNVDNEIDIYGGAAYNLGFVTAGSGFIYYNNVGRLGRDAQEVYFSLSRDLGFATASLTYFWGIEGLSNNGYSELALSRSFELSPCLALNTSTNVGYLVEGGDFTSWTTKVALDWGFSEHAKISPFVAVAVALGEGSPTSQWAHTRNEFTAGSMLSVNF
jgi:hypothetical protein